MDPKANQRNLHGSARWLRAEDLPSSGLLSDAGVVLGRIRSGHLLRFNRDGHVMVFAPTGAGKGIGFVQPNLAEYRGSMVVLDPKGENAIVSAEYRRAMGQQVIVLDPFGKTDCGSSSYNPLGALSYTDRDNLGPMIEALTEALIPEGNEKEPHWTLGARKLVSFLLWFMVAHLPPEERHLVRLFELAHGGYKKLSGMGRIMADGLHPDEDVQRMCIALGNWILGREEREWSYFESQALNNLGWIGDAAWAKVLSAPPAPPLALKDEKNPITVYLVLPFNRIDRYRPWLRVMVTDLLNSLYDAPGALDTPVLFMLDEAYAGLGKMEFLVTAAAAVRGAGARLCFIYQDMQQIQSLYGEKAGSLLSNSGVTLFWKVNDLEAAEYVSRYVGSETAQVPGQPTGMAKPLIRIEEVMQLPPDEIVAIFGDLPPSKFGRINVLEDAQFRRSDGTPKLARNKTYDKAGTPKPHARVSREWVKVDLDTADEMEAKLLKGLSQELGRRVTKNTQGEYGYFDEGGTWIIVG